MERHRSLRDILSGLIFVGIGLAFGIAAAGYEIGTAFRMGPGYFPIVLASVMVLLGAAIVVKGLLSTSPEEPMGVLPWRGGVLLLGSVVFFGATLRGLGLVPCLLIVVFASSMASRRNTPASAAILALCLTLFCIAIFTYALGLPLPLLGPWVRF
jgi:hypothetical protein